MRDAVEISVTAPAEERLGPKLTDKSASVSDAVTYPNGQDRTSRAESISSVCLNGVVRYER